MKNKTIHKAINGKKMAAIFCIAAVVLPGCGSGTAQTDGTVIVQQETTEENVSYLMKQAAITDVLLTETLRCRYKEADATDVFMRVWMVL